jgi:hypothetical protein
MPTLRVPEISVPSPAHLSHLHRQDHDAGSGDVRRYDDERQRFSPMDFLALLAFLVVWFGLQWWLFPRLGIPT